MASRRGRGSLPRTPGGAFACRNKSDDKDRAGKRETAAQRISAAGSPPGPGRKRVPPHDRAWRMKVSSVGVCPHTDTERDRMWPDLAEFCWFRNAVAVTACTVTDFETRSAPRK